MEFQDGRRFGCCCCCCCCCCAVPAAAAPTTLLKGVQMRCLCWCVCVMRRCCGGALSLLRDTSHKQLVCLGRRGLGCFHSPPPIPPPNPHLQPTDPPSPLTSAHSLASLPTTTYEGRFSLSGCCHRFAATTSLTPPPRTRRAFACWVLSSLRLHHYPHPTATYVACLSLPCWVLSLLRHHHC